MRNSTVIVAVLFGIAVFWTVSSLALPSVIRPMSEYIGKRRAGRAVIPAHLDEQEIRDKAAQADGQNR